MLQIGGVFLRANNCAALTLQDLYAPAPAE